MIDDLAQLAIMQDKIDSGDADLWYLDGNRWIEYDDLQDVHGLIHAMHPMRRAEQQEGGDHVLPNIVKSTGYSKDDDTGRSDLTTQFGIVPTKRKPDGSTFAYPLENWNARLIGGTQISVELNLTADDNVTDINADDNVIGMLAWLESLRTTGSAVGDDIEDLDDLADGREYQLDLGTGQATLDLEITSNSHIAGVTTPAGVYSFVGFSFVRVSGETDDDQHCRHPAVHRGRDRHDHGSVRRRARIASVRFAESHRRCQPNQVPGRQDAGAAR